MLNSSRLTHRVSPFWSDSAMIIDHSAIYLNELSTTLEVGDFCAKVLKLGRIAIVMVIIDI